MFFSHNCHDKVNVESFLNEAAKKVTEVTTHIVSPFHSFCQGKSCRSACIACEQWNHWRERLLKVKVWYSTWTIWQKLPEYKSQYKNVDSFSGD